MPTKQDPLKIKWQTPTEAKKGPKRENNRRFKFVQALKKNPGKWAIYKEKVSYASDTTHGKRDYPEVEWTSRSNDDGTFTIYARYIGK